MNFDKIVEGILNEDTLKSLERKLSKDGKDMLASIWNMIEDYTDYDEDEDINIKELVSSIIEGLDDDSEDWENLDDKDKKILIKMLPDMVDDTIANLQ